VICAGARAALAIAIAAACAACDKKETAEGNDAAIPAAPKPVDHLESDELVPGDGRAFSLALPSKAAVAGRFVDVVYADVDAPAEALARYVAARVREGTERTGIEGSTFRDVRIPGDPGRVFRIEITPRGTARSRLEVRDVTPPPVPDLPDEEARWRAVGMKPNGELLDPKTLH